jgi:probable F420-dependent oxidoreductase
MEFGLILPTMPAGASREGIEAAAETAARLGYRDVWTTDHVLVPHSAEAEYGTIFEALITLGYVAGRHSALGLGTSVIVVPQRNAVVLAKELASLDALSGGRVIAGVGVGWNAEEFANLGMQERFRVRGAYLDETIRLWRHLWAGRTDAFEGRFHRFDDAVFGPLPAQGADLPIWIGGRAEPALRRAGRLADGYHASMASPQQLAVRIPVVAAAAKEAGRPTPALSARVRVRFGPSRGTSYAMSGSPEQLLAEIRAFAALGVGHLALGFGETDPAALVTAIERFDTDVMVAAREVEVARPGDALSREGRRETQETLA